MRRPLETAPEKPKWGDPCNGCGYCCASEVCKIGVQVHGPKVQAPCPSMNFHDGRFWCGVVEKMAGMEIEFDLMLVMGIGFGCDSD